MSRSREKSRARTTAASSSAGRAARGSPRAPRRVVDHELLFHLRQCRSDDVVMMHVRADGLDGIEPHTVNQIEVGGVSDGGCAPRW